MPKTERAIHALFDSAHCGFLFGLMRPGVELEDPKGRPWKPEPTEWQRAIWEHYEGALQNIIKLAGGDPVKVWHLGDITHGATRPGKELVSASIADQTLIAADALAIWLKHKQVKSLGFIWGTSFHELPQGSTSRVVAELLSREFPEKRVEAYAHALVRSDGICMDLAHHGPTPGIRDWTRGNEMRWYVLSLMKEHAKRLERPPDLVARGHYHKYAYAGAIAERANGKTYLTHAMVLPSQTCIDDHARKVAKSPDHSTVGMVAVEIINGRIHAVYDGEPDFLLTFDLRETVEI